MIGDNKVQMTILQKYSIYHCYYNQIKKFMHKKFTYSVLDKSCNWFGSHVIYNDTNDTKAIYTVIANVRKQT